MQSEVLKIALPVLSLLNNLIFCIPAFAESERSDGAVLVLMVYNDKCTKYCGEVRPVLQELKIAYGERVLIKEVNASQQVLAQSQKQTEALGAGGFLKGVMDSVPCVGIFTKKRRLVKELAGVKKKEVYARFIDKALESSQ